MVTLNVLSAPCPLPGLEVAPHKYLPGERAPGGREDWKGCTPNTWQWLLLEAGGQRAFWFCPLYFLSKKAKQIGKMDMVTH